MGNFFQFEADFVDSLRCIPMVVRYKLDTCGIKLKLSDWNNFNELERRQLVEMPCDGATEIATYRGHLQDLVLQYTQTAVGELSIDPHPPWVHPDTIPTTLLEKLTATHTQISLSQWQQLQELQRFALIKLSRSAHENSNFIPALQEFGLI
jgi:hypothetical protein